MKKNKCQESLKTCIFMGECLDYLQNGKDFNILVKLLHSYLTVFKNRKALGILGFPRNSTALGRFFSNFWLSSSWIYRIPGIKSAISSNPRRAYQIWCKEFSWIDSDTAKKICDCAIEQGRPNEWRGHLTWIMMEEQRRYVPIISEVIWFVSALFLALMGGSPFSKISKNDLKNINK